jgi:hypothetical protein
MTKQDEKLALWQLIRSDHPTLAAALTAGRDAEDSYVAIDRYPAATTRWIREAVQNEPGLAETVQGLEQIKAQFGRGSSISVDVSALVTALIRNNRSVLSSMNA